MPLLPDAVINRILSPEPIQITILYNEITNQCAVNIQRGGKLFTDLNPLELVLIFSNVQGAYIGAATTGQLRAAAGNDAGKPLGLDGGQGGGNGKA